MIPKRAIELATEGGWLFDDRFKCPHCVSVSWQEIAFDPSFWQCLGKSLGWDSWGKDEQGMYDREPKWMYQAKHFYDLILTNGSTDEFWEGLLATKE